VLQGTNAHSISIRNTPTEPVNITESELLYFIIYLKKYNKFDGGLIAGITCEISPFLMPEHVNDRLRVHELQFYDCEHKPEEGMEANVHILLSPSGAPQTPVLAVYGAKWHLPSGTSTTYELEMPILNDQPAAKLMKNSRSSVPGTVRRASRDVGTAIQHVWRDGDYKADDTVAPDINGVLVSRFQHPEFSNFLAVTQVKVCQTLSIQQVWLCLNNEGKYAVHLPSRETAPGQWEAVVNTLTTATYERIAAAVITAYEATYRHDANTPWLVHFKNGKADVIQKVADAA
jgi:DNA-binding cell septation regulator SpoVG